MNGVERAVMLGDEPSVEDLALMLAARIDSATPSELRSAAIALDEKGNDFRTHRSLRPVYLRISDVIKLVK